MSERAKEQVGAAAARMVEPGMALGLGSGSTALAFVSALGRRVEAGLTLAPAVATSQITAKAARDVGIPLADTLATTTPSRLDLAIDGADEIDSKGRLIKGGGGSLLREKIVAHMADRFLVIADSRKKVAVLGRFPLAVEIQPFAVAATRARLAALGVNPVLRVAGAAPFVTDNGNWIYDLPMGEIAAPEALARDIEAIPAVMAHGLFLTETDEALIAGPNGIDQITFTR